MLRKKNNEKVSFFFKKKTLFTKESVTKQIYIYNRNEMKRKLRVYKKEYFKPGEL